MDPLKTALNKSTILLEFDIKFQSYLLEQKLKAHETLSRNNNNTAEHQKSRVNKAVSVVSGTSLDDENEIIKNRISISEVYNRVQRQMQGQGEDVKYLLCRVITPVIPSDDGDGSEVTIVDEPGNPDLAICLRLIEPLLHLPIGSILLIANPILDKNALRCLCSSVSIVGSEHEILKGMVWESKISPKYLHWSTIQDKKSESTNILSRTEDKVEHLWKLCKYNDAVEFLDSIPHMNEEDSLKVLLEQSRLYDQQSRLGKAYPVHEWLCLLDSPHKSDFVHLNCAEHEGPVCVQNIPGKGRGLIATEFIPKGSVVLAKKAFVISFVEKEFLELTMSLKVDEKEAFNGWTDVLNPLKIAHRLIDHPELAKEFYKLYAGPEYGCEKDGEAPDLVDMKRIRGICKFNGFANRPSLSSNSKVQVPFSAQMTTGLWLLPSYINHSCSDGNVFWRIWADVLFIRAFKDIERNEEVLMSYRGGLASDRSSLFKGMAFTCDCHLCGIESKLSVAARAEMAELLKEVQGLSFEGLGTDFYRIQLQNILDELNQKLQAACLTDEKFEYLEPYLYQPLKLLAMTLLVEGKYDQVAEILEQVHGLVQNSGNCEKSIGCALDLVCTWAKLKDSTQVMKWLEIVKRNISVAYGGGKEVFEIFLKRYKISSDILGQEVLL